MHLQDSSDLFIWGHGEQCSIIMAFFRSKWLPIRWYRCQSQKESHKDARPRLHWTYLQSILNARPSDWLGWMAGRLGRLDWPLGPHSQVRQALKEVTLLIPPFTRSSKGQRQSFNGHTRKEGSIWTDTHLLTHSLTHSQGETHELLRETRDLGLDQKPFSSLHEPRCFHMISSLFTGRTVPNYTWEFPAYFLSSFQSEKLKILCTWKPLLKITPYIHGTYFHIKHSSHEHLISLPTYLLYILI